MKNEEKIKFAVKMALRNAVVKKVVEKFSDIELVIDETEYGTLTFGTYDPMDKKVSIFVGDIAAYLEKKSGMLQKVELFKEICNTLVHEYRHVAQYKKLAELYGNFTDAMYFRAVYMADESYDYVSDKFEVDARKYAEMYFPVGNDIAYEDDETAAEGFGFTVCRFFADHFDG